MKSKTSDKSFFGNLFKLAGLSLLLFLPPFIVWLSLANLSQQIQEEKTATLAKKLLQASQNLELAINPFDAIFRDIDMDLSSIGLRKDVEKFRKEKKFRKIAMKMLSNLKKSYNFDCQVSAMFFEGEWPDSINFINDKQCEKNDISEVTRLMFEIGNGMLSPTKLQDTIDKLKKEYVDCFANYLNVARLKEGGYHRTKSFYRSKNKVKLLMTVSNISYFLVNIVIDLSNLNEEFQSRISAKLHSNDSLNIAFLADQNSGYKSFTSKNRFFSRNRLNRAIKKLSQLPNKLNSFVVDSELYLATPESPQKNYRMLLSSPLPEREKEPDLQFLLAVFTIISLSLWKMLAEQIFLGRSYQPPVRIFIASIFLGVASLPIVSTIYLSSEFIVANFKLEKERTSKKLEEFASQLDLETMDEFRKTLTMLKKIDSIEAIQKILNLPGEENLEKLMIPFQTKFFFKNNDNQIAETWVHGVDKSLQCYNFNLETNVFEKLNKWNQLTSTIIQPRIDNFFNSVNSKTDKNQKLVDVDQVKLEIVDEIFLNIFGHRIYYDLKKSIDQLFEITTLYDKNFMLSIPIKHKGEYKYIFTHIIDSASLRGHFPLEKLDNPKDLSALAMFGSGVYYKTWPKDIIEAAKKFPFLLDFAKRCHLTRVKIESQLGEIAGQPILIATPMRYSDLILATRSDTRNLESFKTEMIRTVSRITAITLAIMLILALLVSSYFLRPINDLTQGTQAIIDENFKIRLNTAQPDEFKEMAETFNHLARQLEEGEFLSSFVSSSLESELENQLVQYKASRKKVAVVFSGINNFKQLLESTSPEQLFNLMQKHLEIASALAAKHHGEIDKMIEDKVMLVFENKTGEDGAAERALALTRELETQFAQHTSQRLAIGLNYGEVVSAIMGSEKARMAKTVVGDPVNLAARLAAIAENQNGGIIVSGDMLAALNFELPVSKLGISSVKGKTQSVEIFAVKRL